MKRHNSHFCQCNSSCTEDILPGKFAARRPRAGGRATGVRVGRRTAAIENNKGREIKRRRVRVSAGG